MSRRRQADGHDGTDCDKPQDQGKRLSRPAVLPFDSSRLIEINELFPHVDT